MKLYVVHYLMLNDFFDYLLGVYSTEQKAREALSRLKRYESSSIQIVCLDEDAPEEGEYLL